MADIYVYSAKTGGADDGSSAADAYLTLAQATAAWTAGDVILVDYRHREDLRVVETETQNGFQ